jgi:hypothetical protein
MKTSKIKRVVYLLKCKTCSANYIGKTRRTLNHRINSHRKDPASSCYKHMKANPGHEIDFENVQILEQEPTDLKIKQKEIKHLLKIKPTINKNAKDKNNIRSQFD